MSVLCEYNGSICKWVTVHDFKPFLEGLHTLDAQNRSKYFRIAYAHARFHMVQNGRPQIKSMFISGNRNIPSVQSHDRPFLKPFLNPRNDGLFMFLIDNRPQLE